MSTSAHIPTGLPHVALIGRLNKENRDASEQLLRKRTRDLELFGESLAALYIAGTCHRKCWGGDHILEKLAARVYNLACAAYSLISIGFYDEALSLARSIGEIANLLSLSVADAAKFAEWIRSSKAERIRGFSPAKVRKLIGDRGVILMDEAWYSELCESYTHVTPSTKPNSFNEENRNVCGGLVQARGVDTATEQLTALVSMIALFYCKYFQLDDFFERIVRKSNVDTPEARS
jgi:hypothetical protein